MALLPDMVSLHGVTCEGTGMAQRPDEPDTQTLGPAALGDADLIIVPALPWMHMASGLGAAAAGMTAR